MAEGTGSKLAQAILDKMAAGGIETMDLDWKKILSGQVGALRRPAISVAIDQGTYKKITMTTYKAFVLVTLFLMVSNVSVRGEQMARRQVIDLVDAIVNVLLLEKLGLPLQDPLIPTTFSNITPLDKANAGYQIYQLQFTCSYNFTKIPDEEGGANAALLKKIVLDYYLHPLPLKNPHNHNHRIY